MFEEIQAQLLALPFAVQLIGLMLLLSIVDFAFAVIGHLKNGTFHGTFLGEWVTSKGLPIITVAILYGLDGVITLVPVDVGGTDLGAFGLLAYAQAVSFIAQEAFSIIKNAKLYGSNPPAEE